MKVAWSMRAAADLRDIYDWIARDDRAAARRTVTQIRQRALQIARHPMGGRKVPERDTAELRELIEGRYRIVYRIEADRCLVVTVLDGARQLEVGNG